MIVTYGIVWAPCGATRDRITGCWEAGYEFPPDQCIMSEEPLDLHVSRRDGLVRVELRRQADGPLLFTQVLNASTVARDEDVCLMCCEMPA